VPAASAYTTLMSVHRALALTALAITAVTPTHAQEAAPTVVVLVRHAEKAASPADDPGLTDAGRARAGALAEAVRDARVDAVITSHYERTRKTAEPVAAARRLEPIVLQAGTDTVAHVREVAAAVQRQPAGGVVLVVGHTDTIPPIIAALGGPQLPDICDGQYARLFTLVLASGGSARLIQSTYGVPDPADPCGRTMIR
jgi:broad specificity phosphatase PhoE